MQKETLSSFVFKVIGKYEDKLRKEQREEIDAKLAYDRAVTHKDTLEGDKAELASQITAVKADQKAYQDELASRRNDLSYRQEDPKGAHFNELINERNTIVAQITEIDQALSALSHAKRTAESALKSLSSAEGWATWDTFTRSGIITHMAKYSHIDEAERLFHTLSSQLRHLKKELEDVDGLSMPSMNEISSGQRMVDFWSDNIFTNLSVRRKVIDNADGIRDLQRTLNTIESRLKTSRKQNESKLKDNRRREEELLLSMCEE